MGFEVNTETAIKNPFALYYSNTNDWNNSHSYQFWNKNFTGPVGVTNYTTKKTIYSPSPSSFAEPKTAAFTGFTFTGDNTTTYSQFNVSGPFNKEWNFYTEGWKTGGTISFYALGYRDTYNGTSGTGNIATFNKECYYWTYGAVEAENAINCARSIGTTSNNIVPQAWGIRSFGFSMRPVKE